MQTFQLILLFSVFFIMAILMFLRKLPALLALPIMAFLIPLISGVSFVDTLQYVIGHGAVKLSTAYTIAIFGSMLSVFLQKTGIAENLIKKGAELSGDKPWSVSVLMLIIIILLFTTLGGLGAIIMVATIVLPIMAAVGIGPITIVGIFLFGLGTGGLLNAGNWALYINVLGLQIHEVRSFALIMLALNFLCALVYITVQLFRDGQEINFTRITLFSGLFITLGLMVLLIYFKISEKNRFEIEKFINYFWISLKYLIAIFLVVIIIINFRRIIQKKESKVIHWSAYLTPLIPLLLILIFEMEFISAFICGLIYGVIAVYQKGIKNIFVRSVFEGGSAVMPAVVLMFGIGMLLNAILGPGNDWIQRNGTWPVLSLLQPVLAEIVPESPLSYVITFTLLAPLALYRGPLNVWGMGYGLAGILLASGMNPGAIMGMLLGVGQIQSISDPTNTHNVWLANEMKVDVQKILWNTLPYTWTLSLLGLIASALKFMV